MTLLEGVGLIGFILFLITYDLRVLPWFLGPAPVALPYACPSPSLVRTLRE